MLYNPIHDRTATQLAYHCAYTAWPELTSGARDLIVWRKKKVFHKCALASFINEEMTHLRVLNKSQNSSAFGTMQEFRIVWLNNSIPTKLEWDRKSATYLINVDLRITKPHGRIAQFSF